MLTEAQCQELSDGTGVAASDIFAIDVLQDTWERIVANGEWQRTIHRVRVYHTGGCYIRECNMIQRGAAIGLWIKEPRGAVSHELL